EASPEREEPAKDETDSSDFFEPADSPEQVESAEKELASPDEPQSEPQAETQAEPPAPEPKEDAPQKSEKSAEPQAEAVPEPAPEAAPEPVPETAPLFEDLPVSRGNIKPKKGDAVIVVNALIGIGNKPYLRGAGAGLSTQKGTQMEYLEIGKWRYVLPDLDAPLNFTVLRNDETPPQGQSQFTIGAGEKMELNLFFPLERETF
ncbi:MAG: hypothetical protein IJI37_00235, partial [Opitutales bacterium]|nr:hypothetical protein [Opitutales bacterium]